MSRIKRNLLLSSLLLVVISIPLFTATTTNAQLTVESPDVLVVWQANSYTPPFYKGKALRLAEGEITVVAIPNIVQNGVRLPASSLVFTWEENAVVLGSRSGIGRDILTLSGSILSRPTDISVTVETQGEGTSARRIVRIPITKPIVLLYENNPLLGVRFENELTDTLQFTDEETVVEAFPYFFSTRTRTGAVTYQWQIGGSILPNETVERVTLRQSGVSGQTTLSVTAEYPFNILESATKQISVLFGG